MIKMYDAQPESAAKQHDLIRALSRKPRPTQRGSFVLKRYNYVLIRPTNANTTHILDLICLTGCHY